MIVRPAVQDAYRSTFNDLAIPKKGNSYPAQQQPALSSKG